MNSLVLIKDFLLQNHASLACCESATAGGVMSEISNVPGASLFFKGGMVCYQTNIKIKVAGISASLIKKYGVFSHKCAQALAEKACYLFKATWGLGITGELPPCSERKELNNGQKRVLQVYACLCQQVTPQKLLFFHHLFLVKPLVGDRMLAKQKIIKEILIWVQKCLLKNKIIT